MQPKSDQWVRSLIGECVWKRHHPNEMDNKIYNTTDEVFQTIKIQLIALGLVDITDNFGLELNWSLTLKGKQEMILRRVIIDE